MIVGDFLRALGQIGDPRFRRVLLLGLGLTIALLVAFYAAFLTVLNFFFPDSLTLPLLGEVTWVDDLASGASLLLMLFLSIFLMVPVASAFTGIFLEEVAEAVEERHYPKLPPADPISVSDGIVDAVNFLGVLIAANLLALVLYLFFPPAAPFIFWGLNGFLLGREYFQLVAMRRLGRTGARQMRSRHSGEIWLAGALMAVPLTIPIINLLVPILGAATFTHLFHRLARREVPSG